MQGRSDLLKLLLSTAHGTGDSVRTGSLETVSSGLHMSRLAASETDVPAAGRASVESHGSRAVRSGLASGYPIETACGSPDFRQV